ncbi:hypothetical protein L1987_87583 [Smallanthus sonchifolius]|nr:hypothetical protein L1987_87583 [Smallanthus sonchifolius]
MAIGVFILIKTKKFFINSSRSAWLPFFDITTDAHALYAATPVSEPNLANTSFFFIYFQYTVIWATNKCVFSVSCCLSNANTCSLKWRTTLDAFWKSRPANCFISAANWTTAFNRHSHKSGFSKSWILFLEDDVDANITDSASLFSVINYSVSRSEIVWLSKLVSINNHSSTLSIILQNLLGYTSLRTLHDHIRLWTPCFLFFV